MRQPGPLGAFFIACALLLAPVLARAQGTMPFYGAATPGHVTSINGIPGQQASGLKDAGTAATGACPLVFNCGITDLPLLPLSTTAVNQSFTPLSIFDNQPSSGNYHEWTFGYVNGVPTMTLSSSGSATAITGLNININGTISPFPGSGGNVGGPTSPAPASGNIPLWHGGTTLTDSGLAAITGSQLHQNFGRTCTGATICDGKSNMDLIADHVAWSTRDTSEGRHVTPGGTATPGDQVGLDWTILGTAYHIRYTMQAGDAWPGTATSGGLFNLAACIAAGGAPNCTVTGGLLNALQTFADANGIGYISRAQVAPGTPPTLVFDAPWGTSNSVATFTSGGATETLSMQTPGQLDNGPYAGPFRWVPAGRGYVAGDQGPSIQLGMELDNNTLPLFAGLIYSKILIGGSNPTSETRIAVTALANGSAADIVGFGAGTQFMKADGTQCGYGGLGNVTMCGTLFNTSGNNPNTDLIAPANTPLIVDLDTTTAAQTINLNFRPGLVSTWIMGTNSSQGFAIANQLTSHNDLAITTGGDITFGEMSQMILNHLGVVQVGGAFTPALSVISSGANPTQLNLVDLAGGQADSIQFEEGAGSAVKWQITKDGSNNLVLTDVANSKTDMQIAASGGALTFGPGQDFVFGASGGLVGGGATGGNKGSGTINVTGCYVNNVACGTASLTLSGDVTGTGTGTIAATVAKVNGVAYGTSPSSNTVPVVTGSNTVTYEAIPNAALAGSIAASKLIGSDIATVGTVTAGTWSANISGATLTGGLTASGQTVTGGTFAGPTVNGIGSANQMLYNNAGGVVSGDPGHLVNGVHLVVHGSAPTVAACGTSPGIAGNDEAAVITVGTTPGGTCTEIFNAVWPGSIAPMCSATGSAAAHSVVATTSQIVIGNPAPTAGETIAVSCRTYSP